MTSSGPVWVIGAGGQGKVVIDTLIAAGLEVAGVLDGDASRNGGTVLGVKVHAPFTDRLLKGLRVSCAVLAIGSNAARARLAQSIEGVEWVTVIHPAAQVAPSAVIGVGTAVFAGAVIQPDARIGNHVIVNTSSSVDHDCILGDYVHIAPGARLAGQVSIRKGTLVGMGSSILPGQSVGEWAIVCAGAVVNRSVPSNVTAIGMPAKWC